MNSIILTQNETFIIGQVAWLLGKIMDAIFNVIDFIGIPNIGLAIILFTIVVNLLMLPLTMKQQKFSKLSAKMNPELQAIQNKYKDKKDNESMMAMQQETKALYAKYGVSPTGSCLQLLIQMPILFALYRVIYSMPAYVNKIYDAFAVLAEKIIKVDNGAFLQNSGVESIAQTVAMYGNTIKEGNMTNGVIDVLNKLSTTDMAVISDHYGLADLAHNGQLILSNGTTRGLIDTYNNFLGLNMGNSPSHIISQAVETGAWILVVGALMIPILSAVTQWINTKLMPQQENNSNDQSNSMVNSMKTMNKIMPLMSAWFCFTLPCGMGLYWIAGSVVRSIQQVAINKYIDRMNIDDIIKNNSAKTAKQIEKNQKLREKMEKQQALIDEYSKIKTKNIQGKANVSTSGKTQQTVRNTNSNTSNNASKNTSSANAKTTSGNAKPGSMMAKANMVKSYNERNNNK